MSITFNSTQRGMMKIQLFIEYTKDSIKTRKEFDTPDQMDKFCRNLLKNQDFEDITIRGFYGPGRLGMFVFKSSLSKGERI